MSKRESITRYSIILKKLRRYPATFQEIINALELESEIQSYNFVVSKRTFQRDLQDIRSIYNIDIQFDRNRGMYYIKHDDQSQLNERILEAFDTITALNIADKVSDHILFDERRPLGTEFLHGFIHAIKNNLVVKFTHQKFSDLQPRIRSVQPYAIKEYSNRFYLMAVDNWDSNLKSFAFDRISELEITNLKFEKDYNINISEIYKDCFGIVSPNGKPSTEVILSFKPHQGKYIKSLPLHASQQIVREDENSIVFKFKIVITEDFIMEILSHGNRVKVLKPDSLAREVKQHYSDALNSYQNKM